MTSINLDPAPKALFELELKYIIELIKQKKMRAAILALNQIDNASFSLHDDVLISFFNPEFFSENSDTIAQELANYNNIYSLLDTAWFQALPIVPKLMQAFNKQRAAASPEFREIITAFGLILQLRELSHLFGSFVPECIYRGQTYNVEGSYPDTFARVFEFDGDSLAKVKSILAKITARKHKGIQQQLLAIDTVSSQYEITPIQVMTKFTTIRLTEENTCTTTAGLHLSSVCFINSLSQGNFIAIGNVGAGNDNYSGIKIYRLKVNVPPAIKDFLLNSVTNPIEHQNYLDLIHDLKGKLVYEIPVLEQLHGYCGLKSAAELNAFTQLYFKVWHCLTLIPLGNTGGMIPCVRAPNIDEVFEITQTLHANLMKHTREKLSLEFLANLEENPGLLKIPVTFFQDLLISTKRYQLSNNYIQTLKTFMLKHGMQLNFPNSVYYAYLKSRYTRGNNSALLALRQNEQTLVCTGYKKLIDSFCHLQDDYDSAQLAILRMQDTNLENCFLYGYQKSRAIAYYSQGPDKVDYQLSGQVLRHTKANKENIEKSLVVYRPQITY